MVTKRDKKADHQEHTPARAKTLRRVPLPPGDDIGAAELGRRVAINLRERRKARGLSLDQLAVASGVSRAALSQIETQKSNPSLGVLWKIAVGLGIPFAELLGGNADGVAVLRRNDAQVLRSSDGRMRSRPLTPAGATPSVEAYELTLSARAGHSSDPHAAGTREVVIALNGQLRLHVGPVAYDLNAGDSVAFLADQPHGYENLTGSEVRCHDIIVYSR
jgi:XRE family transcriptional regulator, regulator of sulfur utilization